MLTFFHVFFLVFVSPTRWRSFACICKIASSFSAGLSMATTSSTSASGDGAGGRDVPRVIGAPPPLCRFSDLGKECYQRALPHKKGKKHGATGTVLHTSTWYQVYRPHPMETPESSSSEAREIVDRSRSTRRTVPR